MQACIYEEYGPADVVRVAEVAQPRARPGEVLVRVHASSVTTADWRFRASEFPAVFWLPGRLMVGLFHPRNAILGMDFAGVVESVGSGVTRFRPGDRVFGATSPWRRAAHAEYLAVPEAGALVHTPPGMSHAEAAAVPFGAGTALAFLRDFARVRAGQRVLIVGASGGVGVWAVQLARHLGAEVTAVCSARNLELVRSLGAEHAIDYAAEPSTRNGQTYDLIFDTVCVTTFASCRSSLTATGTYLPLNNGLRELLQAVLTAPGRGQKLKLGISGNSREGLENILALIAAGALRPVIDRVYPMAQIADAHRHVEGRHRRGSVIVEMA